MRGPIFALVLALAAATPPLAAQDGEPTSPHGRLTLDCASCHTDLAWRPLREPLAFDHRQDAGFPLVASHRRVACASCHQSLIFHHVGTACADCHADPHRGELGVSCEDCHSPRAWTDRRPLFDLHQRTLFPLTGAHAAADCAACHVGAPPFEFAATPTGCVDCHRAEFEATRDPDHVASGFPTTCETCHDTSSWSARGFPQHDGLFFPIFSGAHRAAWTACSDCHVQPSNFQRFECIDCHAHTREEMADEHDDVAGYVYESNACLACHPDGRE